MAVHQLHADSPAGRRVQRPCGGVCLGPAATPDRQGCQPGDEVTSVYPLSTALGRFGLCGVLDSPDPFVSSMPLAGLVNPVTGAPTVGPLAVLVDHAGGLVNHYRKAADEWTLTSELTLEITPDALQVVADHPELAAVATAHPMGDRGPTALGFCEITVGDAVIGIGSVRSFYVARPGEHANEWPPAVDGRRPTEL